MSITHPPRDGDESVADRPATESTSTSEAEAQPLTNPPDAPGVSRRLGRLAALSRYVSPYCSERERDLFARVIHWETGGSSDGFAIVNHWYRKRSDYPGREALERTWRTIARGEDPPASFRDLCEMVDSYGFESHAICSEDEPDFEPCEYAVIGQQNETEPRRNPLQAYSLRGHVEDLRRLRLEERHVIADLVLAGQVTVEFADSNTGKTLLTIWQIVQAIKSGHVDASTVYYMNADDSLNGLLEKAVIAERYGFNMIGDGVRDFRARDFPRILTEITETGHAHGVVLIVDTVKKVTDVMDKRVSTAFGDVARRFAMRGGTAILLAHTNKKLDADGRPVPGGTSDLRQDADCAYTMRTISEPGAARKVVEYENIKRRGDVCQRAGFSYSTARGLTYEELLATVQRVEDDQVVELELATDRRSDADLIATASACIREGIVKRMDLMAAIAQRSRCGRRKAEDLLDKYSGDDRLRHHWTYDVQARGAKVYRLLRLDPATSVADAASTSTPREPGHE